MNTRKIENVGNDSANLLKIVGSDFTNFAVAVDFSENYPVVVKVLSFQQRAGSMLLFPQYFRRNYFVKGHTMNTERTFRLKKWYLDCIGQSGETTIWYAALLSFGRSTLYYSNCMTLSPETPTQSKTTLRRFDEPAAAGDTLVWRPPFSTGNIIWSAKTHAVAEQLFAAGDGAVEWHCLMPMANVRGDMFSGTGYVETMGMTIAPWKLPIETLRWGRAHCGAFSVVWIQWLGKHPRLDVWVNGVSDNDCTIDDGRILWSDGRALTLTPAQAIREGYLVSTVLREIPLLCEILPKKIADMHEQKFLSRAGFSTATERFEGWAIHETVRF